MQEEDAYTLEKVTHCDDCGVCVENWDHHCGVFDRCIGSNNLLPFYSVLGVFGMNLVYVMGALAFFGPPALRANSQE